MFLSSLSAVNRFSSLLAATLACCCVGTVSASAAEASLPRSIGDSLTGPTTVDTVSSPLNTYFIGNSLIGQTTLERLNALFTSQGMNYTYGSQLGAGATLDGHYNLANGVKPTFESRSFGVYTEAFSNYHWDAIVLQPFDRPLEDENCCMGTINSVQSFLDYYTANSPSPDGHFYIYSTWMKRQVIAENQSLDEEDPTRYVPLDYQARWEQSYTQREWWRSGAWATRDFNYQLIDTTRANNPDFADRLFLVPVGDVLYELDQRIKAGLIPSLAAPNGVEQLYFDQVHLTSMKNWPRQPSIGTYVVGLTFYATLAKQNPVGLSGELWQLDDVEDGDLILAIQETVWDVVNGHPYSGVGVIPTPIPEPLTLLGAGTAIAFGVGIKNRQRSQSAS